MHCGFGQNEYIMFHAKIDGYYKYDNMNGDDDEDGHVMHLPLTVFRV